MNSLRKMNSDIDTNQSSKFALNNYFQCMQGLTVIEWVKQKIHEPETEEQTSASSHVITMDDFRVC